MWRFCYLAVLVIFLCLPASADAWNISKHFNRTETPGLDVSNDGSITTLLPPIGDYLRVGDSDTCSELSANDDMCISGAVQSKGMLYASGGITTGAYEFSEASEATFLTAMNLPCGSGMSAGEECSYHFDIGNEWILKIYAESDGSGGVQNEEIRPLKPLNASYSTLKIPNGTALPATCSVGHVFQDTDSDDCADTGGGDGALCICKSANTWALVSNF